jgi:hypothetical protein
MEWYRRNPNLKRLFVCDEFALDDGAGPRAPFRTSQLNGFLSIFFCICVFGGHLMPSLGPLASTLIIILGLCVASHKHFCKFHFHFNDDDN